MIVRKRNVASVLGCFLVALGFIFVCSPGVAFASPESEKMASKPVTALDILDSIDNPATSSNDISDESDTAASSEDVLVEDESALGEIATASGFDAAKVKRYTVYYNGNGATSGSTRSSSHTVGVYSYLTANGFARRGYTFAGWGSFSGGNVMYKDRDRVIDLALKDGAKVTLYAVWYPKEYKLKYDANGGSGAPASTTYFTGVRKKLSGKEPNRKGHVFTGWSTSKNAVAGTLSGDYLTLTACSDVTLYAAWLPKRYTVVYNANGANSGSMPRSTYLLDVGDYLRSNSYGRTGYSFLGWATSKNGKVVYDNGSRIFNLSKKIGDTITLYARWHANTYSLKFENNGGFYGPANTTYTTDSPLTLPWKTPERTGYLFQGWSTDRSGTRLYKAGSTVSFATGKAVTLYAMWQTNQYTVQYDKSASDATGKMSNSIHVTNVRSSLNPNNFERRGYKFAGWTTTKYDPKKTTPRVEYTDGQLVKNLTGPGKTITLYAVWKKK